MLDFSVLPRSFYCNLGTISVGFKAKQLYVFLFSFSVLDGCGETAQPPSGSLDL